MRNKYENERNTLRPRDNTRSWEKYLDIAEVECSITIARKFPQRNKFDNRQLRDLQGRDFSCICLRMSTEGKCNLVLKNGISNKYN